MQGSRGDLGGGLGSEGPLCVCRETLAAKAALSVPAWVSHTPRQLRRQYTYALHATEQSSLGEGSVSPWPILEQCTKSQTELGSSSSLPGVIRDRIQEQCDMSVAQHQLSIRARGEAGLSWHDGE